MLRKAQVCELKVCKPSQSVLVGSSARHISSCLLVLWKLVGDIRPTPLPKRRPTVSGNSSEGLWKVPQQTATTGT